MLKIHIDISKVNKELKNKLETEYQNNLKDIAELALTELKLATPKDTGAAANAWEKNINNDSITLTNKKSYVKQLNAGSSKQAPANFIESTMLNYGKPKGPIVTYE
jgi:hypothetical protein